ncbi:flavodoxin [Virgibacillus sp. MSJ-26]|uniref:flavodoxin n=1 Tax=Virgibacillus sp. MSJ-26 TaxID=2841522 RepID=UPI001C0F4F88|nr:flavodoxin [Virgibacillus sp. MSJ-26]MBU5466052.1 flavodoxin [Virgibacillus sp. MSJ-26]
MRVLIAYLSYSGNTQEVAELIKEDCRHHNFIVDIHRIGIDAPVKPSDYDYIFLGTFTWGEGTTPDEVKDFILEIGYKPNNIAVFGTGDTQFGGDEQFCLAVDKLVKFYNSPWRGLKIEQSPRGSQEKLIFQWLGGVFNHVTNFA